VSIANRFLVTLAAVILVACSGGDDPVPLGQRFPTAADAPGSKPDPEEKRQTAEDFDEFIADLRPALIPERQLDRRLDHVTEPDEEYVNTVFQEAGFKAAGLDVRYFGATHAPTVRHLFSWFIEFESEDGAENVLDWLEAEMMKPCPRSCAARVTSFDVDATSDARGVHRVATAEDIEATGTEDEVPHESFWVGFTDGSIVYTLDLVGPPGSVSEAQAQVIASNYHHRVIGD
jgi:hypothetical protein